MPQGFGSVVLIGLGASTQEAASYLAKRLGAGVDSITLYAGAVKGRNAERAAGLAELGVDVVYDRQEVEGQYDLGVVSPGISCLSGFYRSAAEHCREFVSEPELAWRISPRGWAAVTGTNGKTTTTTLASYLLNEGGVPARPVGNIGLPPIACVDGRAEGEVFVAELSSFQLHSTVGFAPHVAVLLNVTPDHLEWHGSHEAYTLDKLKVFANMAPGDLCLLGDDEACLAAAVQLRARGLRVVVIGREPLPCESDAAWIDASGMLCVRLDGRTRELCRRDDMVLRGPHNMQNALAAAALALEMGANPEACARALAVFAPLEHRIEPCGEVAGVTYYDDSKATNVDASVKAVEAFEPGTAVIMLGGHDKGTDLHGFVREVAERCAGAVCYGEAGQRFYDELAAALGEKPAAGAAADAGRACAGFALELRPHMREAFDAAREIARPGMSVVLSPACSSFDEFTGFEERGCVFKGWVSDLAAGGGDAAEKSR